MSLSSILAKTIVIFVVAYSTKICYLFVIHDCECIKETWLCIIIWTKGVSLTVERVACIMKYVILLFGVCLLELSILSPSYSKPSFSFFISHSMEIQWKQQFHPCFTLAFHQTPWLRDTQQFWRTSLQLSLPTSYRHL